MPDLVVIGGGPAGTAAALAASSRGARVVLVERGSLGGTCVHAGCIPSGALHVTADLYRKTAQASARGVLTTNPQLSWPQIHEWVSHVVVETAVRVRTVLGFAGVEVIEASAGFSGPGAVAVGEELMEGVPVIVATGAGEVVPDLPGEASIPILTNSGAMAVARTPPRLVVLGGGRFSLEWAGFFATIGSEVNVVAGSQSILPDEDSDLTGFLQLLMEERGIRFLLGSHLEEVDGSNVTIDGEQVATDAVLVADDRRANVVGLGLAAAGVEVGPSGEIVVDDRCRTSVGGVFAAGDVTGPPWLSNRAAAQGEVAAVNALGGEARIRPDRIPRSVNTIPELAAVGLTEAQALASGLDVAVGFADLAGSARAIALGDPRGGLKLVADVEFGEILGAHMVGVGAVETIAQVVAAMEAEVHYRDLAKPYHLHPSMAELVTEAARAIG